MALTLHERELLLQATEVTDRLLEVVPTGVGTEYCLVRVQTVKRAVVLLNELGALLRRSEPKTA